MGDFACAERGAREETVTVHKACAAAQEGELRIALVSDLHLGYNVGAAQVQRVVEKINEAQPDVVVLAGDVFDNEYAAVREPDKMPPCCAASTAASAYMPAGATMM